MSGSSRALMPDYLRLIALFGIVVVNVQFIAFSALSSFSEMLGETMLDAITLWLVFGLAMLKSYGLFSFMFGVGLGFLMRSAARRDLRFGKVYRNRMLGLCVLGILHGCLFFPGDILFAYSVTGAILYLFRDWTVQRLVRVGGALLVVQLLIVVPLMTLPQEVPADIVAIEQEIFTLGGFFNAVMFRSIGFAVVAPTLLLSQAISVLGWFCLGLAAVKSGAIDNAEHVLWQRLRQYCLVPGVGLSLVGAAMWQWGPTTFGVALTLIVAPVATLGYLGVIAAMARTPGPLMTRVLAAGGASLTVYLGQSILLSTIFSPYGLGLWSEVSRASAVAISVLVTIGLIAAMVVWKKRFALGPFEWVLRRVTYAGQRPNQAKTS